MRRPVKVLGAVLVLAVIALAVAACGSDDSDDIAAKAVGTTDTTTTDTSEADEASASARAGDPRSGGGEADVERLNSLSLTPLPGIGSFVPSGPEAPYLDDGQWTYVPPVEPTPTAPPINGPVGTTVALPTSFICQNGNIYVDPVVVDPVGGPEQALWQVYVERWDGVAWQPWSDVGLIAQFNGGGTGFNETGGWVVSTSTAPSPQPTEWIPAGTIGIGIGQTGEYRLLSIVGTTASGMLGDPVYLANGGWCTVH